MDLIRQYLASPEFAEAIGNVVVIAIMATAAGIDWKIYGRKTRRRTPPSIDTPQRRRRAAQRRTIPAGHIVIADTVKADAEQTIRDLHAAGVKRTVMLTGDREEVAASVVKQLSLDEFHAQLLPGRCGQAR